MASSRFMDGPRGSVTDFTPVLSTMQTAMEARIDSVELEVRRGGSYYIKSIFRRSRCPTVTDPALLLSLPPCINTQMREMNRTVAKKLSLMIDLMMSLSDQMTQHAQALANAGGQAQQPPGTAQSLQALQGAMQQVGQLQPRASISAAHAHQLQGVAGSHSSFSGAAGTMGAPLNSDGGTGGKR